MSTHRGRFPKSVKSLTLRGACLLVVLIAWDAGAQSSNAAAVDGLSLKLEAAVESALRHNPGLAGLEAQAEALRSFEPQAGALPDPVLALNALNLPTDTFDLDQEPMTQVQLGLSQHFPFPGKRKLRRAAAQFETRAAEARVSERRAELTASVRGAWWRLYYVDRALEIVSQNQNLMRNFVDIAQTRYRVGEGLQQDVLLAQLELSRLLDRELRLKGMRRKGQADLNALLDRPADRALLLASEAPNVRLPELPAEADIYHHAIESRALLAVHRELLEAADARLALARKDVLPDFRLGAGYGYRQGDDPVRGGDRADFFSVMLSVNVPLYFGSKQSKAIEQRTHERSQRNFSLSDSFRSVQTAIARSVADYNAAREQVMLLDTAIIPQAQQTVASMLAGYRVNEVDFLNVMNGQLMLYNAQINYWEAFSDAKRSLANVAATSGMEALYE